MGSYVLIRPFPGSPQVYEHRWVWEQHFGPIPEGYVIDHINGDRSDNRIENLRCCTHAENLRNTKLSAASTTGVKGLSRKRNSWRGAIKLNYKQHSFTHPDLWEVLCWIHSTRNLLHGRFANQGGAYAK